MTVRDILINAGALGRVILQDVVLRFVLKRAAY